MIVRALALTSVVCIVAAIALTVINGSGNIPVVIVLVLVAFGITTLLAIRRGYQTARGIVSDARTLISGDIQHARLVSVGDPKGIFNPESTVMLELEGENGTVHNFERDIPVPFPMAWSYRIGKRFNLPLMRTDLSQMMAFELKREGMDVSVGRGGAPEAQT
jgi:hypothetical protein